MTLEFRFYYNAVGREAIEGLRFLASLPLAGAGREKMQPFNCFLSRLFTCLHNIHTVLHEPWRMCHVRYEM